MILIDYFLQKIITSYKDKYGTEIIDTNLANFEPPEWQAIAKSMPEWAYELIKTILAIVKAENNHL